MGGTGLEHTALTGPKTPISENGGAKSGALAGDFDSKAAQIVSAWRGLSDETIMGIWQALPDEVRRTIIRTPNSDGGISLPGCGDTLDETANSEADESPI